MKNISDQCLLKLVNGNFVGGTLVEYVDRCGFNREFSRGVITAIGIKGNEFFVETSTKGLFWKSHLEPGEYLYSIEEKDGISYVHFTYGPEHALAPKGVEIPKK